jgi:hypothetical protein
MQHLNDEDLARLVDEEPADGEAAHLAACEECRCELDAMRDQTLTLGELADLEPPRDGWQALLAALGEEGLVRGYRPVRRAALAKIAAALVLFAAGGVTGALARGRAPAVVAPQAAPARTAVEAGERLRTAEREYRLALSRYAELAGDSSAEDPVNRLAALEGIVLTTRAALKDSPTDPVINGYHLTALSQRDALLRQISASRSAGQNQPWY